jgi:integrase
MVAYVRAFLRYAYDMGHIPSRLDALDTPRTYPGELLPRAVPWSMVQALLRSVDHPTAFSSPTRAVAR